MSIVNEIKSSFKQGSALTRLIYINLGVFVFIRILHAIISLTVPVGSAGSFMVSTWLSVPASPEQLLYRPWTLFTYMFVHYEFLHILFNMLYLYWFGKIFLNYFNPRQLLGVYLMGGIAGALLYIISYNTFPVLYQMAPNTIMMGASASVMAILFSVAHYAPNHRLQLIFIGSVKLIHFALVLFIIDLISIPTMSNTGGHLSHIGGALFGILYASRLQKGRDITMRFNRFMDRIVSLFKRSPKMKVTHSRRPMTDMEYNANKLKKQKNIDRILDKIKVSGYDSLTKEEKETLFDASNNN